MDRGSHGPDSAPNLGQSGQTEVSGSGGSVGAFASIIPHKPWALQLIRELGMDDRLLASNDAHAGSF
ncbi:MAG: hypothetical protein AAF637_11000, partial [Pseudomonadota bacterium]